MSSPIPTRSRRNPRDRTGAGAFLLTLGVCGLLLPGTAFAGFSVSSFKRDTRRGDNFWGANAALDGRPDTAWMVDPEEKNEGQWIQVDLPSAEVDKLAFVVGFDKGENEFFDYARIKKARVNVFTLIEGSPKQVLEHEINLVDKRGWQTVDIPDTKVGGEIYGGQVRITVLETYGGKDYPNLAVSEVRVHLKEFAADSGGIKNPPDSEAADHDGGYLMDLDEKTFWAATSKTATFGVHAPGFGLASIGFVAGPLTHARPKTIMITANDIEQQIVLEDKPEVQWQLLPVMVGYTGSAWGTITVKIIDAYGDGGVALSEVYLKAATVEDL